MSLKHLAVAAVLGTLAVSACSSSSKSPSSTTPQGTAAVGSTASSDTTVVGPAQNVAADKALAAAAGLKASDFPRDWTQAPAAAKPSAPSTEDKAFAACLGVPVTDLPKSGPAEYTSPSFKAPPDGNPTISDSVGYDVSAATVRHVYSLFAGDKAQSCFSTAVVTAVNDDLKNDKAAASAGVKVGKATVAKVAFPTIGDETLDYRVTIPITAAGQNITTFVDLVIATKGRAGWETDFENIGSPVATDQAVKYVRLVGDRLTHT